MKGGREGNSVLAEETAFKGSGALFSVLETEKLSGVVWASRAAVGRVLS